MQKNPARVARGSELTAAIAAKGFGWKNVPKCDGKACRKNRKSLGVGEQRCRTTPRPFRAYALNPLTTLPDIKSSSVSPRSI